MSHLFSSVSAQQLNTKEQAAREIANKYGAKSEDDVAVLEKRLKSLQNEVKSIKAELADEQIKLKHISNQIAAYEKIVEGNYIDILVRGQQEQIKTL